MSTILTPTGAPSLFGGIGKLEYAPTSAPDDPFPTYVDITPFVRTENEPLRITRGRQTELDTIQPSQLTCKLDNTDLRFTFGLTTGPYGANWLPGKKVRYSETIGGRTFVEFTGYIEFPDIDSWQPIGYQEVSLTCTDRLTRLGRGRPFVSTLAEWIMFNGASSGLVAYWPMNEEAGPTLRPMVGSDNLAELAQFGAGGAATSALSTNPRVLYANGTAVAGDEIPGVTYAPNTDTSNLALRWTEHACTFATPISVPSGQTVAVVAWIYRTGTASVSDAPAVFNLSGASPFSILLGDNTLGTGTYTVSARDNTSSLTTIDSSRAVTTDLGAWRCVAARITEPTGTIEFWHNADAPATGTLGGSPSAMTLTGIRIGVQLRAQLAHLQIYVGPGAYPYAQHLAQVKAGYAGLTYQTTGQRVSTILDYAGVPTSERAIDPGVGYMQASALTGQDPLTAMQNANGTERGRLFIAGDGRAVFHDRVRVLNV